MMYDDVSGHVCNGMRQQSPAGADAWQIEADKLKAATQPPYCGDE